MGGFDHVASEEVVGHDGAADGCHTDGLAFDVKLVHDFGNQAVHDTVRAARAVIGDDGEECVRTLVYDLLFLFHAIHLPFHSAGAAGPVLRRGWG